MTSDPSVTSWLERLRAGDDLAANKLFQIYFERLVHLARAHLSRAVCRAANEEDVAQSAFISFFRGAADGRFSDLHNRDDLWRLLFTLTLRKARDLANRERRKKQDARRTIREVDLLDLVGQPGAGLDGLASPEPPPDVVVSFTEQVRQRLAQLPGDDLRRVALAHQEGHTVAEIATLLKWSRSKVERKLRLIREIWTELPAD